MSLFSRLKNGVLHEPSEEKVSYSLVHTKYDRLIAGADHQALDIAMATVYANATRGDAVAIVVVGPSSSGKTELVLSLMDLDHTYWLSTVTPKTFISGYIDESGNDEKSLLKRLENQGATILLFKDFTSVMSMDDGGRREVISQLREIVDGECRKPFGTGEVVEWRGTLGMIAASTPAIDKHWKATAELGDRWLFIRLVDDPEQRITVGIHVLNRDRGDEELLKLVLRRTMVEYFAGLEIQPLSDVKCSEERKMEIAKLGDLLARARTPVGTEEDGSISAVALEGSGRVTKALYQLLQSLAVVRGRTEVDDDDLSGIRRIVRDSTPVARLKGLLGLEHGPMGEEDAAIAIGAGKTKAVQTMRELVAVGVVIESRKKLSNGRGTSTVLWELNPEMKGLINPTK